MDDVSYGTRKFILLCQNKMDVLKGSFYKMYKLKISECKSVDKLNKLKKEVKEIFGIVITKEPFDSNFNKENYDNLLLSIHDKRIMLNGKE